ncbi:MAG: hypothetical protein HUJ90_00010, partial [Bacteroidales bacterium]|nr:hypothetical protein [Bacteroidales bacterium]
FYAGIEFNYTSKRVYRDISSPVYADLGLRLSYRINRYISVYIKGGNLLCRNNFIVGFIPAAPLNVGGGITITL